MTRALPLAAIGLLLIYAVGIPLFRIWLGFHPICGYGAPVIPTL